MTENRVEQNTVRQAFLLWPWGILSSTLVLLFGLGMIPTYRALSTLSTGLDLADTARAVTGLLDISPAVYAFYAVGMRALFLALHILLSVLILRQRRADLYGIFVVLFFLLFGATGSQEVIGVGVSVIHPAAMKPVVDWINTLGWNLFVTFLFLFPDGRLVPRWMIWPLLGWWLLWFLDNDQTLLLPVAILLVGMVAQIYRYIRVSAYLERRQTKWMVFGLVIFILSSVALLPTVETNPLSLDITVWLVLLLPLSISISILRGQLWDIDIVIRRTLIYGALSGTLALVYLLSVVLLQRVFPSQTQIATVVSTLAIAALFNPIREQIQRTIDRIFYRQKFDGERALETFSQAVRHEVDFDHLTQALLDMIDNTIHPSTVSIWLREPTPELHKASN